MKSWFLNRASFLLLFLSLFFVLSTLCGDDKAFAQADISAWSNERLFDRALRSSEAADCPWALRLYRELLSRAVPARLDVRARYNSALCFSRLGLDDEAVVAYERVAEEAPRSVAARNALYQLALLREHRGELKAARRALDELSRHFPRLSPVFERAVLVEMAWLDLRQRHGRRAARKLNRVFGQWKRMSEAEKRGERYVQGKAHLAAGLLLSRRAYRVMEKSLLFHRPLAQRARPWLESSAGHYAFARRQKEALWAAAADYAWGVNDLRLGQFIMKVTAPRHLSPGARRIFVERRREEALKAWKRAAFHFLRGHEYAVGQGVGGDWSRALRDVALRIREKGIEALEKTDPPPLPWGDMSGGRLPDDAWEP